MNTVLKTLAIAGGLTFGVGTAGMAAELVKFQLDWLPGGDKAAVYYGIELGLFEAAGIEIEFVPGRGSSDAITKLATGVSDIGTAGIGSLMTAEAEGDVPVKALFPVYTKQPDAIFTVEGGEIESIADLAGKRIATATFSSSNATWPLLLQVNEVAEDSVELIKAEPASLIPMLAAGRLDGTVNWVTLAPMAETMLEEAGKKLKVLEWSAFGLDGYGLTTIASDRMIAERPEVVKAFVDAYKEAILAANSDPAAAAAALKVHVPETDPELAAKVYAASVPLIDNAVTEADGYGVFTEARMAETWKWVAKSQGYAIDAIDPMALIDLSFEK
jgi:NitT/TauT family transport system substrate-binding protein